MYKHILVPTDGSALSLKAARAAARLASPLKARITALHVIAPFNPPMNSEGIVFGIERVAREYARHAQTESKKALSKVSAAAKDIKVDTTSVVSASPWRAIIDAARKNKCDLVVMGSHGRGGLAGLLLGSETQKVLAHSKIPVLVCR
jgi:nucleotide-binding universal stress UspA family protein